MASNVIDKAKDALNLNKEGNIKIAGRKVHGIGYGLMGLTWRANPPSQEQAFDTMSMPHIAMIGKLNANTPP